MKLADYDTLIIAFMKCAARLNVNTQYQKDCLDAVLQILAAAFH